MGRESHGIDMSMLARIAEEIKELSDLGVETAVVVGGKSFAARALPGPGLDR